MFTGVTVGVGVAVAVAVGVGVAVGAGVGVGVEAGVGAEIGVGIAVDGLRWHWQRKKAANPRVAVTTPIRARSATILLSLTERPNGVDSRPRLGFSSRECE